tara:strand:- start:328 stop:489 length:162 start_codon:yes stop_codon:yes gene_type:complete
LHLEIKISFIAFIALFTFPAIAQQNQKESLDSIQKLDKIIISTSVIFGNKFVA